MNRKIPAPAPKEIPSAAGETVQIVAGEQEELTYARIHTIVGNEMGTVLLDAAAVERMETGSAPEGELFSEEDGETKSWQIPVGTDVITSLGVTTTFSRLSAGDVIAVLTEEGTDNILKIWIIQ